MRYLFRLSRSARVCLTASALSAACLLSAGPEVFAASPSGSRPADEGGTIPAAGGVLRDSLPGKPGRSYPQSYFRLPLDLPVALSGTFGELRSNHFHTGLDFRTQQRTGHPVFAVADGYISRLRDGAYGLGRAVYVDHPNGYTSVYGHLERFVAEAAREMKRYQYEHESFEADFKLPPGKIPVKKGEIIGYSGNSGSSAGPHLHFEIRDTESEEPINPLLFGLPVPDHTPPLIGGLFIYPRNDSSSVNGSRFRAGFSVTPAGKGNYVIHPPQEILVNGQISFGIIASDQLDGAPNRNGNYSIELKKDGHTIYYSEMDRLNFDHNRALNAHIDYASYLLDWRRIQESYVKPGNPLKIYKRLSNRGTAWFLEDRLYDMEYIVSDLAGNRSVLRFRLRGSTERKYQSTLPANLIDTFYHDRSNAYAAPRFRLAMEAHSLYEDIPFTYSEKPGPEGAWSSLHLVHEKRVPLHRHFDIQIKANPGLSDTAKALVVNEDRQAFPSEWENGWVKAQVRGFGSFYVSLDTIPPRIRPVNIAEGKNMSALGEIVVKIGDDLSGIQSYEGRIDGKWVLVEFDGKTATLRHIFDERTPASGGKNKHSFRLLVTDMKNNTAIYEASFTR